jgi:transposase
MVCFLQEGGTGMRGRKQEAPSIDPEQRAVIDAVLHQRALNPRVRERLEMVKARALGQDLPSIAQWCGRTVRTVDHWLRAYLAGGVAALADAPRRGRPPDADATYRQRLTTAVETPPRDLELGFDVWTSARLATYLAEQTGVALSPGWVRHLLNQQEFVSGRPKHTLKHLQDPEEVAVCQEQLAAAEKKGGRRARPVRTPSRR